MVRMSGISFRVFEGNQRAGDSSPRIGKITPAGDGWRDESPTNRGSTLGYIACISRGKMVRPGATEGGSCGIGRLVSRRRFERLHQQVAHHLAVHVGEAEDRKSVV